MTSTGSAVQDVAAGTLLHECGLSGRLRPQIRWRLLPHLARSGALRVAPVVSSPQMNLKQVVVNVGLHVCDSRDIGRRAEASDA